MTHRGADQFAIRLPTGLRDKIKSAAASNHRSMNSEIVFHLERVFSAPAAAGGEFADQTPAASVNSAALPGGVSIKPEKELPI